MPTAKQYDEYVSEKDFIRELGGLSRVTIWRRTIDDEHFPKLIKMGRRSFRLRSEIEAYKRWREEESLRRHAERIKRVKHAKTIKRAA
jgi:predicted DNA-binding transcriptional regulator AlpA